MVAVVAMTLADVPATVAMAGGDAEAWSIVTAAGVRARAAARRVVPASIEWSRVRIDADAVMERVAVRVPVTSAVAVTVVGMAVVLCRCLAGGNE